MYFLYASVYTTDISERSKYNDNNIVQTDLYRKDKTLNPFFLLRACLQNHDQDKEVVKGFSIALAIPCINVLLFFFPLYRRENYNHYSLKKFI